MDIYRVSGEYIDRLRRVDNTVLFNKPEGKQRPYCGAVASINGKNYFVPMSSPKEKKISTQISIKILDEDNSHLGSLRFHNMIPVPDSELERINIEDTIKYEDSSYGKLLLKQYLFLNKNEERIQTKATNVHKKRINGRIDFFNGICCNYEELEIEHDLFIEEKRAQRTSRIAYMKTIEGRGR